MKEEIKTHNIFLDTSIFIKENFFAGIKLNAFYKHAKASEIELYITDITYRELISNIDKFSHEANMSLKKALKDIDSKSKFFKNIDSLDHLFKINETFNYEQEVNDLKVRLEKQIKKYFNIIEIDKETTLKIIDDYFNFQPPFKDGKKKHEFPDAFVLNSIENWCIKEGESLYVVADDEDLLSFESKVLFPIKEYEKLLEQISYTYSDENMRPKIEKVLEEHETEILDRIKEEFTKNFPWSGYDDNQGFEYEVDGLEKVEAFIDYHSVLYITDNVASVELIVPVEYTADTTYEDTSMAYYDNEDGRYYFTEMESKMVEGDAKLRVIIEVNVELPGKPVEWEEWEFVEIASGMLTNIEIM